MTNSQEKALSKLRRMIEDAEQRAKDHEKHHRDKPDIVNFCFGTTNGLRMARELFAKTVLR